MGWYLRRVGCRASVPPARSDDCFEYKAEAADQTKHNGNKITLVAEQISNGVGSALPRLCLRHATMYTIRNPAGI